MIADSMYDKVSSSAYECSWSDSGLLFERGTECNMMDCIALIILRASRWQTLNYKQLRKFLGSKSTTPTS